MFFWNMKATLGPLRQPCRHLSPVCKLEWAVDGILAQSEQQNANLWRYREAISESITPYTPYKNDISVRVSRVPEFLSAVEGIVSVRYPDFEIVWFGHIGDGNLHLNILKPCDMVAYLASARGLLIETTPGIASIKTFLPMMQATGNTIKVTHDDTDIWCG